MGITMGISIGFDQFIIGIAIGILTGLNGIITGSCIII